MRKLLIFYPFLASYRIDLCNRLAKDFKIKAILTDKQSNLDSLGFDLDAVNKSAQFDYKYTQKGVYFGRHLISSIYFNLIKNYKPDIIWSHEFGIASVISILLKPIFKYKLFITCDDSLDMAINYENSWKRILRKFIIKNTDVLLVVSPLCKKHFENYYNNAKCKFVYFPIIQNDHILYKKINSTKILGENLIKKYGLYNKKIILIVARLDPVKNIDLLIESYKELHNNNNILVIVGDGKLKEHIKQKISAYNLENDVIMTGALTGDNLYAWYYISHFFVLPSWKECFGAVVNEALVAGCKCIVSSNAGASCLIDNNNGYVFQSGNKKDLKEKLFNLLADNSIQKKHENLMSMSFERFYNSIILNLE